MANIMSSMKIPIMKLVSRKKRRYIDDDFNLDLSYILPNLIAMGFPAKNVEGIYRNHIDEVLRFMELKHPGFYKIYNLCSERRYDTTIFKDRVATYPFHDHNPPNIEQIVDFCDDVHGWLNENTKNIAAVHCKAGKGRTGTMICCYMLHTRKFDNAADALTFYGDQRTHDNKGVTIPSQRRYVEYYSHLLNSNKQYELQQLQICEIKLSSPPSLNSNQGTVHFSISRSKDSIEYTIYSSEVDVKKCVDSTIIIDLDQPIPLVGDIKIEFYSKAKVIGKKTLFRFWFNTYFVIEDNAANNSDNSYLEYILSKSELDFACKDKQHKLFSSDFKVQVTMQRSPSGPFNAEQQLHNNHHSNMSMNSLPDAHTPSESPEASSSGSSTGEEWESADSPESPMGRYRLLSETDIEAVYSQDSHNNLVPA